MLHLQSPEASGIVRTGRNIDETWAILRYFNYLVLFKIKSGADVTWDRGDSGAEVTGTEVSEAEVVGAEVTSGRGGSGAEVSVNLWIYAFCILAWQLVLSVLPTESLWVLKSGTYKSDAAITV